MLTTNCHDGDRRTRLGKKMSLAKFPSPLTQAVINGKEKKRTITFPSMERFRVKNIFFDHEYSIKKCFLPSTPLSVVDIGANVGMFSIYMEMTQTIDTIHCFEPSPASLELLRRNTADLKNIHIHPYGLTNQNGSTFLMLHPRNSGENKMAVGNVECSETIKVQVRDADGTFSHLGLTYIDVLKIDTEGCEVAILESLRPRLDYIGIILLEYHSETDRRQIDQLLTQYKLFGAKVDTMDVGTLKYINRRLLRKG